MGDGQAARELQDRAVLWSIGEIHATNVITAAITLGEPTWLSERAS